MDSRTAFLTRTARAAHWALATGVTGSIRSATELGLSYISPPTCVVCGGQAHWLCRRCNLELDPPPALVCPACLRPSPQGLVCAACQNVRVPLSQLVMAYSYESRGFHRLLAAYKERGIKQLRHIFAGRLADVVSANLSPMISSGHTRPIVVYVPCSARRKRQRGFDQAELLARSLASRLKLDFRSGVLTRTRPSGVQKNRGVLERRTQARELYRVSHGPAVIACQQNGVLLIDDVATSLATLETCAMTLRSSGVREVRAAVLAHAALS